MGEIKTGTHTTTAASLKLSKAVLLYTGGQQSYATVNEIIETPDGGMAIGAGVAATSESIGELAKILSQNVRMGGFLPETVLCIGLSEVYWWMPPCKRPVFFKESQGKGIGNRSATVSHPGLVFRVSSNGWSVWAVKGKKRPTPSTKLYQAPYLNVWSSGQICTGSVITPDSATYEELAAWETSFFNSFFTHTNTDKLVTFKGGAYEFWKQHLDGKFKTFPENVLVDTGLTVETLLNKKGEV